MKPLPVNFASSVEELVAQTVGKTIEEVECRSLGFE